MPAEAEPRHFASSITVWDAGAVPFYFAFSDPWASPTNFLSRKHRTA